MRLTSWQEKGLPWGSPDELTGLHTCVQNMIIRQVKLVNMVQVMLVHRILPCQCRTCHLWEYDPAKHQTLLELFETTHEDIWKVLFKANEVPPTTDKDRGHDLTHPANPVSYFMFSRCTLYLHIRGRHLSLPINYFIVSGAS